MNYEEMLKEAIKGGNIELIDKIAALIDGQNKDKSHKAFVEAITQFKSNPPQILKDRVNPEYGSQYITLGQLVNSVQEPLANHGLHLSWDVETPAPNEIVVTCRLSHTDGYIESVRMNSPFIPEPGQASAQAMKSTSTYLRAVTLESVLGIAATNDANLDDDANHAGSQTISDEQVQAIKRLIEESGTDITRFLKWAKAKAISEVPSDKFEAAMKMLENKKKAAEKRETKE